MSKGDSNSDLQIPFAALDSNRAAVPVPPPLNRGDRSADNSTPVEPPPCSEPDRVNGSDEDPPQIDDVRTELPEDEITESTAETEAEELAEELEEELEEEEKEEGNGRWRMWGVLRNTEALMGSILVHLVLLVALAMWMLPEVINEAGLTIVIKRTTTEDALERLSQQALETAPMSIAVLSSDSMSGEVEGATGLISAPSLDQAMVKKSVSGGTNLVVSHPLDGAPVPTQLIESTPYGTLGDARAIVADYDDAFDRITQEILWMLSNSNVLVTWCFDQSESMKDDQKEIRSRIRNVYFELGLAGQSSNEALMTAVTSYGQGYLQHTRRPTANVEEIEAAMDTVPVDPSGKEFMCQAVALSISQHLNYVKQGDRQMALIVVTDESGERKGNVELLEQAIATAQAAKCRIFILGREAVFGYPYAHMKWRHPYTGHIHWLQIDRGPETAFVEQLQTDGFRRRHDAHPSGFGPYEQARMARETGGIFFMLPSLETNLVRGEKRLYELEAMRSYLPNLRYRAEQLAERDSSILRSMLCKVINDLNPYRKGVAEVMEVRYSFSADPARFLAQSREEQAKARFYLQYLSAAEQALARISDARGQEVSPRWQANYDLIYAQVLAYSARTYEYGAFLEAFIANPKPVPFEKPKFLRLSSWHIQHSQKTIGGTLTASYIERAAAMFNGVIEQHAGTPWAARAQWELSRGFGFDLRERYSYYGPRAPTTPRSPRPSIPIPNL